jgi:hypothetical protein
MAATAREISRQLKTAAGILAQLHAQKAQTDAFETELITMKKAIPIHDDATTVEPEVWAKNPAQDDIRSRLQSFVAILKEANTDRVRAGRKTFGFFALLLTVLMSVYVVVHNRAEITSASSTIGAGQLTEVLTLLNQVNTGIGAVVAAQAQSSKPPSSGLSSDAQSGPVRSLDTVAAALNARLTGQLSSCLSFETLSQWSAVWADIKDRKATSHGLQQLRKTLEPELESARAHYFWADTPRRWCEIAWWAEFGTLVGILFYIAGCLQESLFDPDKSAMYFTELLMTPLVVNVVFFLFGFTGIEAFKPNESSMATTVGFAFILGFAIRRTVGLLDTIKKRFLPDPATVDSSES